MTYLILKNMLEIGYRVHWLKN